MNRKRLVHYFGLGSVLYCLSLGQTFADQDDQNEAGLLLQLAAYSKEQAALYRANPNAGLTLAQDDEVSAGTSPEPVSNIPGQALRHAQADLCHRYERVIDGYTGVSLSQENQLNLTLFSYLMRECRMREGLPMHLMALLPTDGLWLAVPEHASGRTGLNFKQRAAHEQMLLLIQLASDELNAYPALLNEGIRTGYVLPKRLVLRVLEKLTLLLQQKGQKQNVVNQLPHKLPADLSVTERQAFELRYQTGLEQKLFPAYQRLQSYLKQVYLPAARESIGIDGVPEGPQLYQQLIRLHTTLDLSPAAIHQDGLAEVAEIKTQIAALQRERSDSAAQPAVARYASRQALLKAYQERVGELQQRSQPLFKVLPQAVLGVQLIDPYREANTSSQYKAVFPGRLGLFWLNAQDLNMGPQAVSLSLLLHEGWPGHHLQMMRQLESTSLPAFRRNKLYTAYVEGWGLYAETLGYNMGLYENPEEHADHLQHRLLRAVRLVVDTGIHSQGWSYEQAIDYMRQTTAFSQARVVTEVERYIAWPAQALAYHLGAREIQTLRQIAYTRLQGEFDLAAFHEQVLQLGAVPLPVLREQILRWLDNFSR
ncbi:DUF885 domain-containing protein [Parvibium lacunae]|nr:DUF885 domain-containing protein [Parvibium lacunae]